VFDYFILFYMQTGNSLIEKKHDSFSLNCFTNEVKTNCLPRNIRN